MFGETVQIKGIDAIKDGQMTLKLEDGRVVNAKDVSYASQDEALVYEAVSNMGVNASAANVLVNAYHPESGVTAQVYAKGIQEAYTYGKYNIPKQEMLSKGAFSSMLTDYQRRTAYKLGNMFGGKETAKAQAAIIKNARSEKSAVSGKVHFDGERSRLTERQSASLSALETIADALGIQIYVFESPLGANGKRIGANGWYDPKNSSVHIDLHAGANGEGTILFTSAHELLHFIKQWSPAKFKILANFLMKEYGKKGVSVESLVQEQIAKAKRNGRDISYDAAYEEVVADSLETMLSDGKVVEKLAKLKAQDKSLWQKIKSFFTELAAKIRKVYEGLSPDSMEGRYVAEMKDTVEKLQQLFTEGLVEASENYATGAQKNTTEDGGVLREQARQGGYGGIREVFAKKGLDELSKKYGNKFPLSAGFDQAMKDDKTPLTMHTVKAKQVTYNKNLSIYKAARNAFIAAFGVKTSVHIQQMGIDASLYADMAKESISKAVGKPNEQSTLDAIPRIRDILSDSVLMGIERIAHTGNKGTALYGYRLYNLYWYDDGQKKTPNCLVCTVVQSTDSAEGYVFHNIENVTVKQDLPGNNTGMPPSLNGNTYTVAQLYKAVKKIDRENGGLKYTDAEKDKYLFAYTERNDGVKYSDRVSDGASLTKTAIEHFGRTYRWKETGYLLTDGTKLDFSGRHEGATGGYRTVDHREILDIYPDDTEFDGNGAMVDFMSQGNIRIMPEGDGINLTVQPTKAQERALDDFISHARGEVTLDIDDANGNTTVSVEYPRGTRASKVLQDIRRYFEDGTEPVVSDIARFHYKDRSADSVSNRSLLANALEGVAQNDIEKRKIQEYKSKVDLINAEEQKLQKLNGQIKELSFSKGPRDSKKIHELQHEAKKTANRINIYDKQLLNLEASKPLQNVLNREKAKAYKRAEQKGKEALADYRERALSAQQKIIERYQESRKKAVENRGKTAVRHKIQRVVFRYIINNIKCRGKIPRQNL